MRSVLTTVAVLAAVLGLAACGSSHHTAFTKSLKVGPLSVPTPTGFRSRRFPGGVVISDKPGRILIPCTTMDGCPDGVVGQTAEDELVVYETVFMEPAPLLKLPLTLQKLQQLGDGRLPAWDTAGSIGGGGGAYAVDVWLGPKAPAADRPAILDALQAVKSS